MQLVNRATSDITSLKSDPELSISLLYTIITIHVVHHTFTRTVLHKDRQRERKGERVNWNGVKNFMDVIPYQDETIDDTKRTNEMDLLLLNP